MFLRLVTHIIRAEESEKNAEAYAQSVLSALRSTKGCAFASLLQNTDKPQECISLTIWKSRKDSEDYEKSGLYTKLVDSLRPYFADSNEWKLELTEDLSLEYTPIQIEPTIERFDGSVAGSENISKLKAKPFAVQILELTVQEDQVNTFEALFASEIHPKYKAHKGFIDLILLRQQHKFHVISFWDETVELQSPGIHSIGELLESIYKILPASVRWRVSHASATTTSATSEDLTTKVYRCLTAEWFTH
ncbi:MAG TPA: antibiotic biosynthesis monooxygenase [Bacteroidota bacterium]|nr:antibiotic biosynthesis monooxygenase [Bacteroidota bacterium]